MYYVTTEEYIFSHRLVGPPLRRKYENVSARRTPKETRTKNNSSWMETGHNGFSLDRLFFPDNGLYNWNFATPIMEKLELYSNWTAPIMDKLQLNSNWTCLF